jgi:tRNA A37 threonylcarbamoyltransferase TsaD
VKISDNNIENIFNININIQGVFSNNIEQDIVNVVVGLLNQQGAVVGGGSLKDQLMALAQKSDNKDLDLNIPVGSAGSSFNFDGLASKIQEAIAKKSAAPAETSAESETSTSDMQAKAKDLLQKYITNNPQLKL